MAWQRTNTDRGASWMVVSLTLLGCIHIWWYMKCSEKESFIELIKKLKGDRSGKLFHYSFCSLELYSGLKSSKNHLLLPSILKKKKEIGLSNKTLLKHFNALSLKFILFRFVNNMAVPQLVQSLLLGWFCEHVCELAQPSGRFKWIQSQQQFFEAQMPYRLHRSDC